MFLESRDIRNYLFARNLNHLILKYDFVIRVYFPPNLLCSLDFISTHNKCNVDISIKMVHIYL